MRIVPLCLDYDPSLIPLSCKDESEISEPTTPVRSDRADDTDDLKLGSDIDRDPDDFSFWSEKQAKRICAAIEQAFGVEYAPEVVIADANLTTLANRILVSKEILTTGTG
jgi:phosphatidylethanolamine N-methyltransferase